MRWVAWFGELELVAAVGVVAEVNEAVAVVDGHGGLADSGDADEAGDVHAYVFGDAGGVEGDDVLDFLLKVGEFEGDLVGGVDPVDLAADAVDGNAVVAVDFGDLAGDGG